MKTSKSYTDIEQSKRLAEILSSESADMCWDLLSKDKYAKVNNIGACLGRTCVYAWSLAALMNLLPSEFTEKGKYSETSYKIDIRKYKLTEDVDIYQIAYGNYHWHEDGSSSWSDMINTGEKENLIDAAFQMIIWLKENNKL